MFLTYDKRTMDTAGGDGGSSGGGGASGGAGTPAGAGGAGAGGNSGSDGGGSAGGGGLFDDGSGAGAPAGGQGAGSGNGGSANGQGAGSGNGAGAPGDQSAQDWKASLPDELKNNASLARYKTPADLAKAYTHLESLKGSDKIAIPKAGSDAATMRAEVFEKLGLPKNEADYKLELKPEGAKVDPEFHKVFQKMAYDNNLLPAQGQALLQWFADANDAAFKAETQAHVNATRDKVQALRTKYGQAYDQEIGVAKAGMKEFLQPEEIAQVQALGLGTEPFFVNLMNKLGHSLTEDQLKGLGAEVKGTIMSPAAAQAEIKKIQADPKGAYYDKNHADHATVKKHVGHLFGMAYPGPSKQAPVSVQDKK